MESSIQLYKLTKITKCRIETMLSNEVNTMLKNNFITSSYIDIPEGIIITINKDDSNPFDIIKYGQNFDNSINNKESNYIYQNPYHLNYYTGRIIRFDFDDKIIDSEQFSNFKNYYLILKLLNTLKNLNKTNFGEIYLTICIDDYQKI